MVLATVPQPVKHQTFLFLMVEYKLSADETHKISISISFHLLLLNIIW